MFSKTEINYMEYSASSKKELGGIHRVEVPLWKCNHGFGAEKVSFEVSKDLQNADVSKRYLYEKDFIEPFEFYVIEDRVRSFGLKGNIGDPMYSSKGFINAAGLSKEIQIIERIYVPETKNTSSKIFISGNSKKIEDDFWLWCKKDYRDGVTEKSFPARFKIQISVYGIIKIKGEVYPCCLILPSSSSQKGYRDFKKKGGKFFSFSETKKESNGATVFFSTIFSDCPSFSEQELSVARQLYGNILSLKLNEFGSNSTI